MQQRSPARLVGAFLVPFIVIAPFLLEGQDAAIAAKADSYLSRRSEMGNFSGAVLIARGDKVLFRKAYGYADLEKRVPYTPETQHHVASISKMFTAMALLKLRDAGRLELSDPLCRYVEDCPPAWASITIDEVIHHTSGIPDYESGLGLGSEEYTKFMALPDAPGRILALAKSKPLDFKPGEKFNYSNTGYMLLNSVVEKAAGVPFAKYVQATLLGPAGMTSSGVLGTMPGPARPAAGYTYGNIGWEKSVGGVAYTDGHMRRVGELDEPTGGAWLYSTLDDLLKWSRVMDGSALVPRELAAEAFKPALEGYAAGWIVDKSFDRTRIRHTGSLPGYVSNFIKFPDDSVTIVIFANIDRGRMSSIVRDLTAITFGLPYDMPVRGKVVTLTAAQYAPLLGEYRMDDGRKFSVSMTDMLTATLEGQYEAGLIPMSATEFYFPLGDGRAIFKLDGTGRAIEVNMRYAGTDHIARRVPAPSP
jgi:CubicO group peptidase (beta-lactamase class C family)